MNSYIFEEISVNQILSIINVLLDLCTMIAYACIIEYYKYNLSSSRGTLDSIR